MVDTASQGFAPLVAMETPLDSTTALILAFLCITPRQTVPPCVGTGPCQPRAWVDTRMCVAIYLFCCYFYFFATESGKRDEMEIRWVGLAEGTKERRDVRERDE